MQESLKTSVSVPDDVARMRIDALTRELRASGDLLSEQWETVFRSVRRHVFVPRFYRAAGSDPVDDWRLRWRAVDGSDPAQYPEWLNAVYSNETLITELTTMPVPEELGGGAIQVFTSSSTMPGLMLRMLEALDVHDGHRVMEIGTGTGYNAALLCARLGPNNVTTLDIDPALTAIARRRLGEHGFHPTTITGDGTHGAPEHAPYDRIIATTSVERIPVAWLQQARSGANILCNLRLPLARGALVLLHVVSEDRATGRFQPGYASFMNLRHHPGEGYVAASGFAREGGPEKTGTTRLDPQGLHTDDAWPFFASLILGTATVSQHFATDNTLGTSISDADGSYATCWHNHRDNTFETEQSGPRKLWDELEKAFEQWHALGKPGWQRFTITVTPEQHLVELPGHPEIQFSLPGGT